jgi:hypothetical protein
MIQVPTARNGRILRFKCSTDWIFGVDGFPPKRRPVAAGPAPLF